MLDVKSMQARSWSTVKLTYREEDGGRRSREKKRLEMILSGLRIRLESQNSSMKKFK